MVSPMTELAAHLTTVRDWLDQVKQAGLELPRGWFGRPYDNQHEHSWSAVTSSKILLELDQQILVIITEPGEVLITAGQLRIAGCRQVCLDWQEYGNMRAHVDDHGGGSVTFHGPVSTVISEF